MKPAVLFATLIAWTILVAQAGLFIGQRQIGDSNPGALLVTFRHICGPAIVHPADARFIERIDVAMTKMMTEMAVRPAGSADEDFVAAMVPHHEGAIEMAEAELQYGRNPQLTRIAQEVIVSQQDEISAMRLAVGQALLPSGPARVQISRPKDL
jgi:hypothetical protein